MTSYFTPSITIDADNIIDYSKLVGIVPTLIMPAEVNRMGFVLQNLNDTNDFWWGYDNGVSIGGAGYFCLRPTDPRPFWSPQNGVWRGAIYGISDGGGRITAKSWLQV